MGNLVKIDLLTFLYELGILPFAMGFFQKFLSAIKFFLLLFLFSFLSASRVSAAESTTWTVLVGGEADIQQYDEGPAGAWQFMRFYPDNITINAGDTIVWKLKSAEPHTVTFPKSGDTKLPDLLIPESADSKRMMFNPMLAFPQGKAIYDGMSFTNSGELSMEKDALKEFKLTFDTPGTFEYLCAFHSKMKGKVIVQPRGSKYPKTQQEIDKEAVDLLAKDTEEAKSREPGKEVTTRPGSNGSTIYTVKIGYGDNKASWMRFVPSEITIHEGDMVEWVQNDIETPHTITLTSGAKERDLVLVEKQENGPPKLIINPDVLEPRGGTTYSGKDYFNSGFLWGKDVPLPGPKSYTLTFDKAGNYEYICSLHDTMGMKGKVIVQAKTASFSAGHVSKKLIGGIVLVVAAVAFFLYRQMRPKTLSEQ